MLSVLEGSIRNQKKGMNMAVPKRIYTAAEGLAEVETLSTDIKTLLNEGDPDAVKKERAIRDQVFAKDLQKYDDALEKLLKTP